MPTPPLTAADLAGPGALALCERIKAALHAAHLLASADARVEGLLPAHHHDVTSFNVAHRPDGKFSALAAVQGPHLDFHVSIDGEASGLHFREFSDLLGEDVVTVHEPDETEKLHAPITAVFTALGFTVLAVQSRYQSMWYHSVGYNVYCAPLS